MKKVLFITYYWPPSGKASLHWPLKIIKHLPDFGYVPVVLTVNEDKFSHNDDTFINEIPESVKVLRSNTIEPFDFYKKFTGKSKDDQLISSETISTDNKSTAHRISLWIRLNIFIPDARVGWYFPAVKAGSSLLEIEKIDAVISVGPPHSTHLIGKKLSSKFSVPFVPAFIDPWTDIAYYKNLKRNKLTLAIDNKLEKSVMKNSSAVVFVTQTMKEDYEKKYPFIKTKSNLLYWGYSEEDFTGISYKEKYDSEKVIVHAGNMFSYQNPVDFWKEIKKEIDCGTRLRLKFIGTVAPEVKESITQAGLKDYSEYAGFLPYKKMLEEICSADYLLVCATEPRHVPGKLFEYLRTGKPIIAFGDNNEEVKNILKDANAGMIFGYNENGEEFFKKINSFNTNKKYVKNFERKIIAQSLSDILISV